MPNAHYAPAAWLGTRLASKALHTEEPYDCLSYACREGEERLRRLAGLVAGLVMEADWLDREAELRRRQLALVAGDNRRHTDRAYTDAATARTLALQLEEAATARDRTVTFLRRLLICYRAAAVPDTP